MNSQSSTPSDVRLALLIITDQLALEGDGDAHSLLLIITDQLALEGDEDALQLQPRRFERELGLQNRNGSKRWQCYCQK